MKDKFDDSVERLTDLITTLNKAQEALALLEKVWLEMGAYGERHLTDETRWKLQDFFGFDDSE